MNAGFKEIGGNEMVVESRKPVSKQPQQKWKVLKMSMHLLQVDYIVFIQFRLPRYRLLSFLPLGSVRLLHATDWNRTKVRYTHFGIVQNERTSRPYGIQCNCTWQVCRTHSAIERGREHHLQLETVFFGHKCSYSPGVLPTIKWVIVVSVTSYTLVHNRDRFFGSLFVIWNAKHAYVRSAHIRAIWLLTICYQLYIRYDMEQKRTQQTKWRASYNFYSSFSPWSNVMCVRVENPIYSMAFLTVPLRHPLCLCVHCTRSTAKAETIRDIVCSTEWKTIFILKNTYCMYVLHRASGGLNLQEFHMNCYIEIIGDCQKIGKAMGESINRAAQDYSWHHRVQ